MINYSTRNLLKLSSLQYRNFSPFVKQKQIDQISKNYGQTKWQKTKMYCAMFKYIGIQGFKGLKNDFKLFKQLKKKQPQTLTIAQTQQLMRINQDIYKMGPLIIIDILPFTGPLFMLYMYTYPGSIPSWFLIDYYHDRHEQLKVRNQKKNLAFFKQKGLKPQQIDVNTLSLRQLRKLTLLLFGFYRDGTIGYRKLFNKKIEYFLFEGFSRCLLKRDLQKKFKRDLFCNKITNSMANLNQKIRWRYSKIMNGEFIMEHKSLYADTVTKMAQDSGEQVEIFNELQKYEKQKKDNLSKKQ